MRNRTKYDWTKPFKLIDSKRAFDELETNDDSLVINLQNDENKAPALNKDNIPVPKIENVRRQVTETKPHAKITPNYIRLPAHLNLPREDDYELTEVDHVFLQGHQDKFKLNGKTVLTQEFLSRAFIELQKKGGKSMDIPKSKGWIMAFIQREYKDIYKMENVEAFGEAVYNFWKNRREELKFPLLRSLWKPGPEQYNHLLAFKARVTDKRNLRRTSRFVEEELIEELFEEFELAVKITDRIQMREQLKHKQVQLQINYFHNECKAFFQPLDIVCEITPQSRAKDKERLKKFHANLDNYKSKKETEENDMAQDAIQNVYDQKLSVFNFLATVVYEAEALGINHEKIFHSIQGEKARAVVPAVVTNQINKTADLVVAADPGSNSEEILNFTLRRMGNLIFRSFDEETFVGVHQTPCKSYLDYKRKQVDSWYFGSDDEGDTKDSNKDIKKNISASFKKFLQLPLNKYAPME